VVVFALKKIKTVYLGGYGMQYGLANLYFSPLLGHHYV
jgi:hypothetical protein